MPAPPLGLTARAVVERVVDGDTVDVSLRIPVRVRLLDCWAPEIHGIDKIAGFRAMEALEKMLPKGTRVHVHVPSGQADALADVFSFGRVLGDVFVEGDDESVSQLMVGQGMATRSK